MRKQVIAYLHTHWDREWYREFEIFRMRLLRVFDNVLEMLEANIIPSFYFDGQVAALLDYLEIRPEKESLVRKLIHSKKLFIGPFYCLVDEFLTDKTCFSKNLEIGLKTAADFGCTDFIGYLPDTFGHSKNVPDILRDYGIDKCIVWRGCGDFPADFKWCGMDTVNLVRGYFQDVFSLKCDIEKKAEILKKNLDLIAEKSGDYILFPVGADHLGVEKDINDQIIAVNEILKEDYVIKLSSPFEYFKKVESNFNKFRWDDELRDNSKTFILPGTHSSRLDLKKLNIECTYKLDLASRFVKFQHSEDKYRKILEYAYKLLLQNQAHDGICGCSTDDVHQENIIRYKKILQIAQTVIDEQTVDEHNVLNLSDKVFSGVIEIKTAHPQDGYEKFKTQKGFERNLLCNTQRIPVTEDYREISTYTVNIENLPQNEIHPVMPAIEPSGLEITDTSIENQNIRLEVKDGQLRVNNIPVKLIDFADNGDSYNNGPKSGDSGVEFKILKSKIHFKGKNRVSLKIDYEGNWDIIPLIVTLDKNAAFIKFEFDWINTQKNHLLEVCFTLPEKIKEVFSEDMNTLIKRNFNPDYNIRDHLPKTRGIEAFTNTAPMQRGLIIDESKNNIGLVTKGLTQYEIYKNNLLLPILRSTGVISNPKNPARTTPAGPPIETPNLQMIGRNTAEFYVFFGNHNAFNDVINQVYSYIIA